MVGFLFFWVPLLYCLGDLSEAQTKSDVVNVGAIFTFGSINGRVSKVAMKAAQDDINSDPTVLGGRKLFIKMHDSNFSGFLGIIGALQFMETDTVAIIGPQTSGMAHILSHIGNQLHVPLLSFTALDPTLSPLQYPYFIQTAPNDLYQMTAIADMISYYGWGEVIAMFTDDDNCRNSVAALGDQLSNRRCKISYKSPLPPDPSVTRSDILAELEKIKMMESRVIVLHTFSKTGLLVFEVAKEMGMMEQGYVWFTSAWLSTVLDSTGPVSAKTASSISGAITVRPHVPDSEEKAKFVSRWKELSNGSVGVNPYALYAYDTVWVIARAVKQFLDQGNNISFSDDPSLNGIGFGALNLKALSVFDGGTQVLTNILETDMTGLTGPFKFNPDRALRRPSFDVINVLDSGYREIGFWTNYSGLSVVSPEVLYTKPANQSSANQHLSDVVWPGGTRTQPRGWVFPDNGRKLRIGVPNRVSYRAFVEEVNSTDRARGYCIDVFLAALKLLPYAVPFEFVPFGDGHKNPNYNELVNMIAAGVFDAAVGDIAIVTNRTRIADFTQPYAESGLVVVAPVKKMNSNAWAFLRPFTGGMWAVTAVFFLIIGTVIWILEHRINDEFRGPPREQIVTVLWFSFSTMFFAHRENLMSTLGRMVLIVWLFIILVINSSYTASLTSILTVQQLSSPIAGIDSLIMSSSRVGYQVGSYAEDYLVEELNIPRSRLVALGSPEEYAAALSNGTVAAVVDEMPYIDVFLSTYCHFKIRGEQFTRSGWGFAFPRDSPLAVDMSTAILSLSENGDLQKIHDQWLWKKSCGSQSAGDDSVQLRIQSFWGLFLICGVACFLALLAYLLSTLRKFSRHAETEPSLRVSSKSRRLQTFLLFADEKEDRAKNRAKRKRRDESLLMNGVNTPSQLDSPEERQQNGVAWHN